MNRTDRKVRCAAALAALVVGAGCAGVQTSRFAHSASFKPNEPAKAEGCYDAAVMLNKGLADSTSIAKKVLAAVDSTITETTETAIKAQRNRHIGVFVGSGGEELFITLKPVSSDKTFVTVGTKTGFVGGAGQKAWSCQVVDQMVAMATR